MLEITGQSLTGVKIPLNLTYEQTKPQCFSFTSKNCDVGNDCTSLGLGGPCRECFEFHKGL